MSQNGASPTSPYRFLRSKGVAEEIVTSSNLKWTVIKPSVIFGPEDEFVNVLARLVRLSPLVFPLPGGGVARFQPIAVDDVARAVRKSLDDPVDIRGDFHDRRIDAGDLEADDRKNPRRNEYLEEARRSTRWRAAASWWRLPRNSCQAHPSQPDCSSCWPWTTSYLRMI